jgi:hypothetical protein
MIAPGLHRNLDHELNRTADSCDLVTQSDSVGLGYPPIANLGKSRKRMDGSVS